MAFEDDLNAENTKPTPFQDVPVLINETVHTFRFHQMNGFDWASEVDRHPPRGDVLFDVSYGYNVRTLTKAVALQTGVRLEGDNEVPLKVTRNDAGDVVSSQWDSVWQALSGNDFQAVSDAIWQLNYSGPQIALRKAVERAKKAPRRNSKASA